MRFRTVSSMQLPFASVVILNWNGSPYLDDCLESVLRQEDGSFEVLLVDNGSTDGSADHVRHRFPSVVVVEAGENLGFAGGTTLAFDTRAETLSYC